MKKEEREPQCQRVMDAAGGAIVIGIALGMTSDSVNRWRRVPAEYVLRLEQLTGIPGREMRPDMYLPLNPIADDPRERSRQMAILLEEARTREVSRRAYRGSTYRPSTMLPATPNGSPPAATTAEGR